MFASKKNDSLNSYKRRKSTPRAPIYTLHARTAERRSEMMHKVGAITLLIAAIGGVGWLMFTGTGQLKRWIFFNNDRFLVTSLDITSTGQLSPDHIKEFGGISEGVNLFDLDIDSIKSRLEDGPMIKSAEVQRRLPGTLTVRINERVPLARIAHGQAGFYFTVDLDGHVLGLAGRKMASMPVVKGFSDRGISPGSILRDGGAIDALNVIAMCDTGPIGQFIHIQEINVGHSDYLELLLEGNIKVLLPRNPPRSKLDDLVLYLRESGGKISFIDLTLDRNVPAT